MRAVMRRDWQLPATGERKNAVVVAGAAGTGDVYVRNSSDWRPSRILRFTRAEWDAFTGGVLAGEFDRFDEPAGAEEDEDAGALAEPDVLEEIDSAVSAVTDEHIREKLRQTLLRGGHTG